MSLVLVKQATWCSVDNIIELSLCNCSNSENIWYVKKCKMILNQSRGKHANSSNKSILTFGYLRIRYCVMIPYCLAWCFQSFPSKGNFCTKFCRQFYTKGRKINYFTDYQTQACTVLSWHYLVLNGITGSKIWMI